MEKNYIFSENDYNSNEGMMTSIWGPPFWHILHTISFNYPVNPTESDKKNYLIFFNQLIYVLPCKSCRDNLKVTSNFNLDVFKNRYTLSKYIYDLHEIINDRLGKKSNLTYYQIRDRFEIFRSRCNETNISSEIGCIIPLNGIKSKCVLSIVPNDGRIKSFKIDPKCIKKK